MASAVAPLGRPTSSGTVTESPAFAPDAAVSSVTWPVFASTHAPSETVWNVIPPGTGWLENSRPWCQMVTVGAALRTLLPTRTCVTGYVTSFGSCGPVTRTGMVSTCPADVRTIRSCTPGRSFAGGMASTVPSVNTSAHSGPSMRSTVTPLSLPVTVGTTVARLPAATLIELQA